MDRANVLRAGAACIAGATFIGANAYVLAHPKNPAAPLQPPLASAAAQPPAPQPTAASRGSARATPRPTPRITLQPGVRATELPGITYTHVS